MLPRLFVILSILSGSPAFGQAIADQVQAGQAPSLLPAPGNSGARWELVFADEFGGQKIDRSKWAFYGDERPMVRRDGYWTDEAAAVNGLGQLVMTTRRDSAGNYYSACLHTQGIFEKRYGYFEIRVQLHNSEGHWPAFWLYSGAVFNVGRGGVDGAEIDIFEKFTTNRKTEHNIHWDGYDEAHQGEGKRSRCRKIMDGFHYFGLWWSEEAYRFYVDGELVWETDAGGICEVPLNILISDEVGNHKRMRSIEKANLPDQWLVDHVRIYDLVID